MEKKKKKDANKKFRWQEWLLALAVTLVLLAAVVGYQFWLTDTVHKTLEPAAFWRGNIIGDAVGGLFVLLLVHHFIKKPKEDD